MLEKLPQMRSVSGPKDLRQLCEVYALIANCPLVREIPAYFTII